MRLGVSTKGGRRATAAESCLSFLWLESENPFVVNQGPPFYCHPRSLTPSDQKSLASDGPSAAVETRFNRGSDYGT